MSKTFEGLLDVLMKDEQNVEVAKNELGKIGVTDFFEELLRLIDVLRDITAEHAVSLASPFTRSSSGSVVVPANLRLRFHMLNSAYSQFVFAASHLYRCQASEAYGHTRRAIEAAGIAYLTKSKSDIGDIYFSGDTKKLRNNTKRRMLFPEGNTLTERLCNLYDEASAQQHNNMISMVKRIEEEIIDRGETAHYQYKTSVHDQDDSMRHVWSVSYHILTSGYFVVKVLADSFDLPSLSWHQELENYKSRIDRFNVPFAGTPDART